MPASVATARRPTLAPDIPMTVTFYSDRKGFAFAARHDTGASCYISPMLAEQAGLTRNHAGCILVGTVTTNTDDHGGSAAPGCPWRVMSWSAGTLAGEPAASPPAIGELRTELVTALEEIERSTQRLRGALARLG